MTFTEALNDPRAASLSPEKLSVVRERLWAMYQSETPGAQEKWASLQPEQQAKVRQNFNEQIAKHRPEVFSVTVVPEKKGKRLVPVQVGPNAVQGVEMEYTEDAIRRPLYDPKTEHMLKAIKDRTLDFAGMDDEFVEQAGELVRASLTKEEAEPFFDHYRVRLEQKGIGPTKFADTAFARGLNPVGGDDSAGRLVAAAIGPKALVNEVARQEDYRKWRIAWGELDDTMRMAGSLAAVAGGGMGINSAIQGLAMRAGPKVAATLVANGALDYSYADNLPGFSAELFDDPTAKRVATAAEGAVIATGLGLIGKIARLGDDAPKALSRAIAPELEAAIAKASPDAIRPAGALKTTGRATLGALRSVLAPVSTVLENIAPELKASLRQFEHGLHARTQAYKEMITPMVDGWKRMAKADAELFDEAAKNGDAEAINGLVSKYKLTEQYAKFREALDLAHGDAKAAGYEVGYLENFFPRKINDYEGYMTAMRGEKGWGEVDRAIEQFRRDNNLQVVPAADQARITDNLYRGYGSDRITGAKPGALKERKITKIDPKFRLFYERWDRAASDYIDSIVNATEKRRFFGANLRVDKPLPFFGEAANEAYRQSIGGVVSELVSSGKIKPTDQALIGEILKARMVQRPAHAAVKGLKNATYLWTMGQLPATAARQLQDVAVSAAMNGYFDTVKALVSKKAVRLKDLGLGDIGAEFGHDGAMRKAVDRLFTWTGVKYADRLTKETYINAARSKARKIALNSRHPEYGKLGKELANMFGTDAPKVMDDLANGRVTDNTKLYLFNKLADVQPIAMSEMPKAYLSHPNARLFYTLKSFTIKQADLIRREAFREMAKGNVSGGLRRLVTLTVPIVTAGATIDSALDLMYNRKPDFGLAVVDNLLRMAFVNRYTTKEFMRTGDVGQAITDVVAPPTGIITDAYKDVKGLASGKTSPGDMRSLRNLPFAGQLYYWWFGGGAERMAEKDEQVVRTR